MLRIVIFFAASVFSAAACQLRAQDDLDFQSLLQPMPGTVSFENGKAIIDSPALLEDPDHFVWGGSVIKGEDGRYHMFYSIWDAGPDKPPFQDGWLLGSEVAYAVSPHPDRGFTFQKVLLTGRMNEGVLDAWDSQSVHNPHIRKFGDTYYLYFIGSHDPGPQQPGSPGAGLSKRNRVQQVQKIGVLVAGSIEDLVKGNWTRPDEPLLSPRTRVKAHDVIDPSPPGTVAGPDNMIVVNPSVVYRPRDGTYLLFFKGNLYDPSWRGVHGVATAPSPTGPFEDGTVLPVHNLERPQLLFDENGRPQVLYRACSVGPVGGRQDGNTVNVHLSLRP